MPGLVVTRVIDGGRLCARRSPLESTHVGSGSSRLRAQASPCRRAPAAAADAAPALLGRRRRRRLHRGGDPAPVPGRRLLGGARRSAGHRSADSHPAAAGGGDQASVHRRVHLPARSRRRLSHPAPRRQAYGWCDRCRGLPRRLLRCARHLRRHHRARCDARRERRRRILPARRAPDRKEVAGPDRDGRAGHPLPRDRRALQARAAAGDAGRQRAHHGALAGRGDAPPGRVGDRPLLADGSESGRDPARLERGCSCVSLGGERARRADGLLEPGRLRRDRTPSRRGWAAEERRREPRQPPLRRGRPRPPYRQPGQRGEEGESRLPRLLRQRLQCHALARRSSSGR